MDCDLTGLLVAAERPPAQAGGDSLRRPHPSRWRGESPLPPGGGPGGCGRAGRSVKSGRNLTVGVDGPKALGADVTGIDLVGEFIDHARANFPGPEFRLGSMTELDVPDHSVAGILSWYSTIHLPPQELGHVLTEFRRMLTPSGRLVIGFFDSDDEVAAFDHKVLTAYRWPVDEFAALLTKAGFTELQRLRQQFPDRPDRRYAAIAASAT